MVCNTEGPLTAACAAGRKNLQGMKDLCHLVHYGEKIAFKSAALTCSPSYFLAAFHKYWTGNFKVNRSADLCNPQLFRHCLSWMFHTLQITFIYLCLYKQNIWCIVLHSGIYGNLKCGCFFYIYHLKHVNTKLKTEPYFSWKRKEE